MNSGQEEVSICSTNLPFDYSLIKALISRTWT